MAKRLKGSDLLVAALESEGVDRIFGVPGEENLDTVESLRTSSIELVITRHEQAAAFMAATHGRLTGRPGVCIATLGPGALNFSTGAAYAHLGAMPMIMLTGQKAIMTARQARFQIVDVIASMKPLTKMTRQIVSAASIPAIVREAFRVAMEERPGPVHLELPEDVAGEAVEPVPLIPPHPVDIPVAHPAALDRAAEMILRAKNPLIMLGAAASRPRMTEELSAFVHRTRLPFFNTQMGKGTVAGGSNLYMGTAALSERDYVHRAVDRADLIITIGHDTIEKPPFIMGEGGPQVIHISYTPANVEQVYFPHAEVVGDVGPSLTLLADRLEGKLQPGQSDLLGLRAGILEHIADRATEDRFPVTPQRLVHDVRQVIPSDGIVCLDNGMYKIWFARNYRTYTANTLLLDNALATMGAGLPSAMMAKLLYPERRVLAVCGDGGFMMNSPGAGDRGAARARSGRADPGRLVLRHDPLEAGGGQLPRLRPDLRQSRLRQVRGELWRAGLAGERHGGPDPDLGAGVQRGRGACGGGSDRLQREHPRAHRGTPKPRPRA